MYASISTQYNMVLESWKAWSLLPTSNIRLRSPPGVLQERQTAIMGKRKTKKKQTAAKRKTHRQSTVAFGVGVTRGSSSRPQEVDPRAPKHGKRPRNKISNDDSPHHPSMNHRANAMETNATFCENGEFKRLQASLEERSAACTRKRKRSKRERMVNAAGWGAKFARPGMKGLAPASFSLVKTTEQLVQDAVSQVAQLDPLGKKTGDSTQPNSFRNSSSLSAAAGKGWRKRIEKAQEASMVEATRPQKNSFAVLECDSDSDNDWPTSERKHATTKPFAFNPASFTFQPPSSVVPPKQCQQPQVELPSKPSDFYPDEFDPDL